MSTEAIRLGVLACPEDGQVLEPRVHGNGDGTVQCPKCDRRYELYELDQQ